MAGTKRIGFLLFDGVKALDYVGPAEVFVEANQATKAYEVILLSPSGAAVTTSVGGVAVSASAADAPPLDTLIVPGSEQAPSVFVTDELLTAAATLVDRSARVVSICSGAFVLAELGLLDGRGATTHWKFAEDLARRFPRVDVQPDRIFVRDRYVATSAGVAAGIDLSLALVEDDLGAAAARRVAQGLLIYLRRSGEQTQFSTPLRAAAVPDSPVRVITELIAQDPAYRHSVISLARHVNISPRHLTRLFQDEVGMSPAEYAASVRFDLARSWLEAGCSVAQAASDAGFSSAEALRRTFAARLGVSPSAYRRRFRSQLDVTAPMAVRTIAGL
ncbi:GlxA family transcriptional regulator [Nocardioides albus]|uniref:Transcriptional regulator GlxA family with amidase domain n=1 Tax=Nocardioides albus TaxID=1841 RepID=A0A7W5FAH8_9ACTN|nr:helix-turn-helix domain-containing protein [Nocardioides albus]MBB3091195.1 transcriptional regulator GlxA family with amidase domain [Nocardioides albus]GGU33678.1 putative transcription regulator, AraC family protein [Nocardioides albus]